MLRLSAVAAALALILPTSVPAAAQGFGVDEPPADLTVRFEEGMGPDLFHVENTGTCLATVMSVTIDLSSTVGGLVFDTEAGGGGANAAYPFILREGGEKITGAAGGEDGGRLLTLELSGLRQGERVVFSIDVDDALEDSPWGRTRIAGPEFDGGGVRATLRAPDGREMEHVGRFGPDARAYVNPRSCAVG
ncbi:putative aggregation factor core protein MAFp3 [Caenispirillum salinarum AK4]|uniref:Putative aggregation factor core protein MAFp3 n=1 Tax=Caenispirillum salinarum AK4 TaxID=1238182 RepID=K9H347_9PROT|nr:hypothetical protein [Caenispirillum salinarum]EKV32635.1 putative aggregation factor core protein MAFp3 [Caenispirillum salinarum AK4]